MDSQSIFIDCIKTSQTPKEGALYTDTAHNGHTFFFTTLHYNIPSGTMTVKVKINTGAQTNTIPLSKFKRMLPKMVNDQSKLAKHALIPQRKSQPAVHRSRHHTCTAGNQTEIISSLILCFTDDTRLPIFLS